MSQITGDFGIEVIRHDQETTALRMLLADAPEKLQGDVRMDEISQDP
jgi:hypothetical protein